MVRTSNNLVNGPAAALQAANLQQTRASKTQGAKVAASNQVQINQKQQQPQLAANAKIAAAKVAGSNQVQQIKQKQQPANAKIASQQQSNDAVKLVAQVIQAQAQVKAKSNQQQQTLVQNNAKANAKPGAEKQADKAALQRQASGTRDMYLGPVNGWQFKPAESAKVQLAPKVQPSQQSSQQQQKRQADASGPEEYFPAGWFATDANTSWAKSSRPVATPRRAPASWHEDNYVPTMFTESQAWTKSLRPISAPKRLPAAKVEKLRAQTAQGRAVANARRARRAMKNNYEDHFVVSLFAESAAWTAALRPASAPKRLLRKEQQRMPIRPEPVNMQRAPGKVQTQAQEKQARGKTAAATKYFKPGSHLKATPFNALVLYRPLWVQLRTWARAQKNAERGRPMKAMGSKKREAGPQHKSHRPVSAPTQRQPAPQAAWQEYAAFDQWNAYYGFTGAEQHLATSSSPRSDSRQDNTWELFYSHDAPASHKPQRTAALNAQAQARPQQQPLVQVNSARQHTQVAQPPTKTQHEQARAKGQQQSHQAAQTPAHAQVETKQQQLGSRPQTARQGTGPQKFQDQAQNQAQARPKATQQQADQQSKSPAAPPAPQQQSNKRKN